MSLAGKTLCFTGTLTTPRASATAQAQAAGGAVTASVTGKTTHLVAGPGAGSKVAAAQAKGVAIWTEEEFFAAMAGAKGKGKRAAKEEPEEEAAEPPKKAAKATAKGKKAAAEPAAVAAVKSAPAAVPSSGGGGGGGGGPRPDRFVPNAHNYTVIGDLDAKLMQTNIGGESNNNKFYILQCLSGEGQYRVLFRWGRLGEPGQSKIEDFGDLGSAQARFEKQFREKTANAWASRGNFVKKAVSVQALLREKAEEEEWSDVTEG